MHISQKPTLVEPQSFFHRIVHTSAKKEGAIEKILTPQEVGQIRIRIRTVIRTVQKSHATHTYIVLLDARNLMVKSVLLYLDRFLR